MPEHTCAVIPRSGEAHEIAHVILEHPLSPALGVGGCRRWDPTLEDEADWQAGALLVPREAALRWIQSGRSLEDGAVHFGVSLPLFRCSRLIHASNLSSSCEELRLARAGLGRNS